MGLNFFLKPLKKKKTPLYKQKRKNFTSCYFLFFFSLQRPFENIQKKIFFSLFGKIFLYSFLYVKTLYNAYI